MYRREVAGKAATRTKECGNARTSDKTDYVNYDRPGFGWRTTRTAPGAPRPPPARTRSLCRPGSSGRSLGQWLRPCHSPRTTTADTCPTCGIALDQTAGCPRCTPRPNTLLINESETLKVTDYARLIGVRDGKAIAYRETPDNGRTANADTHDGGTVSFSLAGSPPQNEEDSLRACGVLVRSLNQRGGTWSDPVKGTTDDVDGESQDVSCRRLKMQVVRADVDQGTWRGLAVQGAVTESDVQVETLADRIAAAVRLKAALPPTTKAGLTLVLDATRLPGLAFDGVAGAAQTKFAQLLQTTGFRAVWLVGPDPLFVHRLG